jgi:hypothetical protein
VRLNAWRHTGAHRQEALRQAPACCIDSDSSEVPPDAAVFTDQIYRPLGLLRLSRGRDLVPPHAGRSVTISQQIIRRIRREVAIISRARPRSRFKVKGSSATRSRTIS